MINCSSLYGPSVNSEGGQSISASPTEMQISGDLNTTSYRTITFTNNSEEENYEIYNMAFADNDCGAYSVYNILDEAGNMLYQTGDAVSISVVPGASINVNLQFSPTSCSVTEYTTIFIIYYLTLEESLSNTVSLVTTVNDNAPDALLCDSNERVYYDEYDNPTERTLPALPEGEYYYLKVTQLNAYLKNTGAFASYSFDISTHIDLDIIPEDEWYSPVYLILKIDEDGTVTLLSFDECTRFDVPTAITDTFFLGADLILGAPNEAYGTIDRVETPGRLEINNLLFSISSYINNSNSLIQDSDGLFNAFLNLEILTTGEVSHPYIEEIPDVSDDFGVPMFNIIDDRLIGKDIRHGTITLVGIATFAGEDDTKMSNEAYQALVDNEAYYFLHLEGEITQEIY